AVASLIEENAKLKKEAEKAVLEHASDLKQEILHHHMKTINGITFVAAHIDLPNADAIKNLAFAIKEKVDNLFLVFTTLIDDKPGITVMISEDLVAHKGFNASAIVRELAKDIQGGGGGQPFYATAGGKNKEGLPLVLAKAEAMIK